MEILTVTVHVLIEVHVRYHSEGCVKTVRAILIVVSTSLLVPEGSGFL